MLMSLTNLFFFSFNCLSARVSNELGAKRPRMAQLAICVSLALVITEGSFVGAVMILGRHVWGYCYSGEERVVKYVAQMMILISVSHFFDGIQAVLSGQIPNPYNKIWSSCLLIGYMYIVLEFPEQNDFQTIDIVVFLTKNN